MSTGSTAVMQDIAPVATTAGTPGELLRARRLLRQLSVQQAAEDLHLDVKLVEAIEANNFQALGAPVYAKGHMRKYAVLLGLSPDTVMESYQSLTDVPLEPTSIPVTAPPPRQRRRGTVTWFMKLLVLVAIVAIAAAIWWGIRLLWAPPHVRPPVAGIPAPGEAQPAADTAPVIERASSGTVSTSPPVAAANAALAAPTAQPASAPGPQPSIAMRLEFSAASWTEIYDAAGNRLMYDIAQPGQVRTIAGVPPLKVTIGVAAAAAVAINDRVIAVPRQPGRDTTRFVVLADGSVR